MTRLRGLVKSIAARLLGFVVARPALDAFLRRQVYRFPGLAGRVRAAVARSRRGQQNGQSDILDEADLTEEARAVLRELLHAVARARQS
jgi:hypothetical protein